MTGKFEGIVIVSDLDGTFLGSKSSLVPENLEAIHYFCQNGGIFSLATGRCKNVINCIFPNAKEFINGPAILCGGAYLYHFDTDTMSDISVLNKNQIVRIISLVKKYYPKIGFRVNFEKGFLCPTEDDYQKRQLELYPSIVYTEPLENYFDFDWYKIVFSSSPEVISAIPALLKECDMTGLTMTTSCSTLFEILSEKATKGNLIPKIKAAYGGENCKVICVGDYLNDLDMLSACDIAACPANALDEVKQICSTQLCDNTHGCIADLIYNKL